LRQFVMASAALLALAGVAPAFGAPLAAGHRQSASRAAIAYYKKEIAGFQKATWHWQRLMGVTPTPATGRALEALSADEIHLRDQRWASRARTAYRQAQHPPHLQALLCIHNYEGSWRDTGGPYYGGLQMDLGFQQTYGGWLYRTKGTADHWAPLEQIWAAERAVRGRGFWPGPSTARACGGL